MQLTIYAGQWVRYQFRLKRSRAESLQYLDSLSPEEAFILVPCVVRNRRTITLTRHDPVASPLREKGLLEGAQIGTLLRHPHIVPDFVWKRLKSRPPEWLPTDSTRLEHLHRAADGYFGDDCANSEIVRVPLVPARRFPITGAQITYAQIAGDSGTGGATLTAVGNNSVIVDAAVPGIVNLINLNNQQIYNPTRFQLTTAEQYVYTIDQALGVTAMTDPNGNTLTINSNGIIHSSGKSIVFNRDSSERVSKVTDPSGNELNYSYSLAGDLASFTDREGNTTNFSYNATNGLLTIMDPRGIQPIRNDYDADGRLISHTDAFNHVITYTQPCDESRRDQRPVGSHDGL
jgi:YD repeat-containing protein